MGVTPGNDDVVRVVLYILDAAFSGKVAESTLCFSGVFSVL